jgi:hypothetical protein
MENPPPVTMTGASAQDRHGSMGRVRAARGGQAGVVWLTSSRIKGHGAGRLEPANRGGQAYGWQVNVPQART